MSLDELPPTTQSPLWSLSLYDTWLNNYLFLILGGAPLIYTVNARAPLNCSDRFQVHHCRFKLKLYEWKRKPNRTLLYTARSGRRRDGAGDRLRQYLTYDVTIIGRVTWAFLPLELDGVVVEQPLVIVFVVYVVTNQIGFWGRESFMVSAESKCR